MTALAEEIRSHVLRSLSDFLLFFLFLVFPINLKVQRKDVVKIRIPFLCQMLPGATASLLRWLVLSGPTSLGSSCWSVGLRAGGLTLP